jgi:hypothetical protein
VDFDPNLTLAIRRIPAKILCMQLNEPSWKSFSNKLEVRCDWSDALDYDIKYVRAFREMQHACYIETLCSILEILAGKTQQCLYTTLCTAKRLYVQVVKLVLLNCLILYRPSCN